MSEPSPASQNSYGQLLRTLPAFRDLWIGQAISQLGDSLYYLVFLFMVEKITHDPAMVGVAGVAQTLPFLLLSPYAGVLADRIDRRTILLWCDIASGIALVLFAGYVFFDATPPVWTLIVAGASLSAINSFFAPAKGAAIPQLVPEDKRDAANALSLATQNLLPMVGIALSGTVLAVLYAVSPAYFFMAAIVLNAASFFGSAVFIVRLPRLVPEQPEQTLAQTDAPTLTGGQRAWQDLRDGFSYLKNQRVLWI
ncbi:MAG: MFS transporter, partial [Armatimonadetes bacterium]|nr:MFS transporter [Armatimonadota bacterium]